ncbi:MAG TPA: hypothetical protein PKA05_06965 [Roseiflexaceae bacterium]|mgnify:CR=1 FL=1|nr:hypothetical protein [Roseiflexaceae bacterium]HMP40104.1 hypothetical protein [Roseiflexaceae bacterium]
MSQRPVKRPRGLGFVVALIAIKGFIQVALFSAAFLVALSLYTTVIPAALEGEVIEEAREQVAVRGVDLLELGAMVALAVFALVGSIGLQRMRPWGWLMVLIVYGTELAIGLYRYTQRETAGFELAIGALVIFYLNARNVRRAILMTAAPVEPKSLSPRLAGQADADDDDPADDDETDWATLTRSDTLHERADT